MLFFPFLLNGNKKLGALIRWKGFAMEEGEREAYIQGRIMGLRDLVSLLKKEMEGGSEEDKRMVKVLVMHISEQLDSLIGELKEVHGEHPVLKKAEKKNDELSKQVEGIEHDNPSASKELKKSVGTADELMEKLLSMQK